MDIFFNGQPVKKMEFLGQATKFLPNNYPLKTNIFPENWWLEDEFSFQNGPFFRGHVIFFGGVMVLNDGLGCVSKF